MAAAVRRFRTDPNGTIWPEGSASIAATPYELALRHLLLVPSDVPCERVAALLADRIADADLIADAEVSTGRHSNLTGPYELSHEDAVAAQVPLPWTVVYALAAPVEREDPPPPGVDDSDGLAYAFPAGMPWREEGRGLGLLVSLARRLSGAVRPAAGDTLIVPDPERAVDFVVHAPVWLEPDVLLGVVARELPTARLAIEGEEWFGPPEDAYSGDALAGLPLADPLDADELAALHAMADEVDMAELSEQDTIDAYAIVAPLPDSPVIAVDGLTPVDWFGTGVVETIKTGIMPAVDTTAIDAVPAFAGDEQVADDVDARPLLSDLAPNDGDVEVLVRLADRTEPVVLAQPWADHPVITYEIRWQCPDPAARERRVPGQAYLDTRARVKPVIAAITRAVAEATHGVVVDEDGFAVDRYTL
ncbi:MAG: hypothetical protein U0Q15_04065 [Kineosporiaceae bacterium]